MDEEPEDLLSTAIVEIRERFNSQSKHIYTSLPLKVEIPDVQLHHPQRGDKKKIVDLSLRNARYFMLDRLKMQEKTDPERHSKRIMQQLKDDLQLSEMPEHIECFDNSNFQGSYPVAACVVFKNAKPSKKDYRHFNIKTVEGPDDFASMREVIHRRYTRLLNENEPLPQLLIVDGGKGQLSAAVETLKKMGIYGEMAVVGIAKRLEEIYFPYDPVPLYIDKKSESLKLIQRLRNEAHRFGITHHRNKRSKGSIGSVLNVVPGIGPKTEEKLLKEFRSIKRIKEASDEALLEFINQKQLKSLRERL
jgi:excinuclease ABC subunit C